MQSQERLHKRAMRSLWRRWLALTGRFRHQFISWGRNFNNVVRDQDSHVAASSTSPPSAQKLP